MQLPEPLPDTTVVAGQPVPAHHRPPHVMYQNGVPYHFTVGQPPPPAHITVQLPEQQGMSQQQREFMMYALIWLVVAVVLTGCACAVTVIMGGTLMGIIGILGANAAMIGVSFIGIILAAGWAATKIKGLTKQKKG